MTIALTVKYQRSLGEFHFAVEFDYFYHVFFVLTVEHALFRETQVLIDALTH